MTKIYVIYFGNYCEFDAVFDEKLNYIGGWDCNDATWRNEYFRGFMKKLGIEVLTTLPSKANAEELEKKAYKEIYGSDPE
jgi:hypothetical protein